ncbi:Hypothetical protein FKW44_002570, partial [Caligus rogercresseyi]
MAKKNGRMEVSTAASNGLFIRVSREQMQVVKQGGGEGEERKGICKRLLLNLRELDQLLRREEEEEKHSFPPALRVRVSI